VMPRVSSRGVGGWTDDWVMALLTDTPAGGVRMVVMWRQIRLWSSQREQVVTTLTQS
jgi:hypothetical protein